jgi:hypothetical protein
MKNIFNRFLPQKSTKEGEEVITTELISLTPVLRQKNLAEATRKNYPVDDNPLVIMGSYLRDDNLDVYREKYPGRKIIIYQLEPISEHNLWWPPWFVTQNLHQADEVWDYDVTNIHYLREQCGIPAFYRPFLYSDTCCNFIKSDKQKDIDILFLTALRHAYGLYLI